MLGHACWSIVVRLTQSAGKRDSSGITDVGLFVSPPEIHRNPVNDLYLIDVTLVCEVHNGSFADRIVGPGGTLEIHLRVMYLYLLLINMVEPQNKTEQRVGVFVPWCGQAWIVDTDMIAVMATGCCVFQS